MLNNLIEELKKLIEKEYRYASDFRLEENLLGLFILKYYCDTNKMTYEDIIKQNEIKELIIPSNNNQYIIPSIKNTKLLLFIQYEDIKDIINEYLEQKEIGINIINGDGLKLCISRNTYNSFNILYDRKGKTTYAFDNYDNFLKHISIFQFFDKVLELDNKYVKYQDLTTEDYQNYKYIYIYDNTPRYRFIKDSNNDMYSRINNILKQNDNLKIILHSNYKKVSNIQESKYIIKYMSKVLIYDDINAFIYYEKKEDNTISIINYNKTKIKSLDRLFEIIKNNRKQKDILVKTTVDEIRKNHYRLGFRLYQSNVEDSIRNINEIVDENTNLIERLSNINKTIEEEINNLINR